jgi:hypothetical protein
MASIGLFLVAGCQWLAPQTQSGQFGSESMDRKTLQSEHTQLSEEAERLRAELEDRSVELARSGVELETQIELNRLLREELDATTQDLEYLETQFITFERELTASESKASAVAAMADVRVMREKILREHPNAIPADVLEEVDERLKAAEEKIALGQFAIAAYHARRGQRLLTHSERRHSAFLATGTPRFVSVTAANLRDAPDSGSTVIARVPYGTILVELERREAWLLVRTRDGGSGWIHSSVIR